MDLQFKELFLNHWHEYFGGVDLPIVFQYSDNGIQAEPALSSSHERCVIQMLQHVRDGRSLRFFARSFSCLGGKFYTGYSSKPRANIGEFLSCGIEGELRGERYKSSPEVATKALSQVTWYEAPASHLVFKRWDMLDDHDEPEVVIFFALPDVLAALYTLSGFDDPELEHVVIAPFGSGCASIIQYPYSERLSGRNRAVIGMFDLTARPHVNPNCLSFAVTMERFRTMVNNMPESFLITTAWDHLRKRIPKHVERRKKV